MFAPEILRERTMDDADGEALILVYLWLAEGGKMLAVNTS